MNQTKQTWEATREPNLLRNTASGKYYGRFTIASKQKWINLGTDVCAVAKLRLAGERSKVERPRQTAENVTAGGAFPLRVYARHRWVHSLTRAAKARFGPIAGCLSPKASAEAARPVED